VLSSLYIFPAYIRPYLNQGNRYSELSMFPQDLAWIRLLESIGA